MLDRRREENSGDISPTQQYLEELHRKFRLVQEGSVATYIPELAKADPNHFGIAMVTANGSVYEVGDSEVPFTIQSISKPFVYGMALEDHGFQHVLRKIGVEPTGDAFNSISLAPGTGRPRNPMINAGAIAAAGLILGDTLEARLHRIIEAFSRYAGRRLTLDRSVYRSESETGHRNRAIGHLLRNFNILESDPEPATELYFMQCSISVTCRDLSVMGATLANGGVNPVTGKRALAEEYVSSVLSVMSSCGMYDYAGEWLYKVGMPAKSGVAGGLIAILPGQLGIAVYSPRLDPQGNTVRGIRVCEAISRDHELHLFSVSPLGRSVIRRKFSGLDLQSTRTRPVELVTRLNALRPTLHIYQLQGAMGFPATEAVVRDIMKHAADVRVLVLDFKRVLSIKASACRHLENAFEMLLARKTGIGILNIHTLPEMRELEASLARHAELAVRIFDDSDVALEWAEDQLLGETRPTEMPTLSRRDFSLFRDLSEAELAALDACLKRRLFPRGTTIVEAGADARELFFLARGSVSVWVPLASGAKKRVATFCAGMAFGEMALLDGSPRSASVIADTEVECDILGLAEFDQLTSTYPRIKITVLKNLGLGISGRLREANRLLSVFE